MLLDIIGSGNKLVLTLQFFPAFYIKLVVGHAERVTTADLQNIFVNRFFFAFAVGNFRIVVIRLFSVLALLLGVVRFNRIAEQLIERRFVVLGLLDYHVAVAQSSVGVVGRIVTVIVIVRYAPL